MAIMAYEPLLGALLKSARNEILQSMLALRDGYDFSEDFAFLDCCCGPAGFLHGVEHLCKGQAKLVGVDVDMAMLREARKQCPSNSSLSFMCANATSLPFKDASFHVAAVSMALHAMPYEVAQKSLVELCRVAKHVLVVDYCLSERNIFIPAVLVGRGIEWLVGGEHYACYKHFMHNGGLEGLCYALTQKVNTIFTVKRRRHTLGGAGLLLELESHMSQ